MLAMQANTACRLTTKTCTLHCHYAAFILSCHQWQTKHFEDVMIHIIQQIPHYNGELSPPCTGYPELFLKMAELPVEKSFVAKNLDSFCVSCGDKVEELLCLPCLHPVSVCEKEECRQKVMKSKISCSQCKEVFDVPIDGFSCHFFATRRSISEARKEEGTFVTANTNLLK